jgi:hypothetical protein
MLIIHFRHSRFQARTIIKNTPYGLSSVVIYSLVVYFAYEKIGIVFGTIIALICSVLYVIIQGKVLRFFKLIK